MQNSQPNQFILRYIDQQVRNQGYLKVIFAPVATLGALGTIFAILGNNWLLFGTVVGVGTCVLVLLLLTIEHMRASALQEEVSNLGKQVEQVTADLENQAQQSAAAAEKFTTEIEEFRDLIGSVRWLTERLAVCCSTVITNNGVRRVPQGELVVCAEDICRVNEFKDLQKAVFYYAVQVLGHSKRRLAVYYGDEKRLEPVDSTGWPPSTNPRILVAGQPSAPLEVNAMPLIDALKIEPAVYVEDLTNPSEDKRKFVDIVPDRQDFRTLACFRLASLPSVWSKDTERATLLGVLMVQDARADALSNTSEREFFTVLANALATGFLSVRLNLVRTGGNRS